ncbi:hypothetical protein PO878_07390 [Iamia majanohamensis]|uniref:Uncharacterized protein n=1 Tax=Iamia majanohamensis TaxID=467976 RepID=A0AAE9Y886_9ACTN|nr:hypothetical protein [Iamia majanohamensis]WCO68550.1 hypothetical protein PO878_07390 [Iamia majanohamensis]
MATRVLFYGGNLLLVVVICQDVTRRAMTSLLGDSTGESLYAFVRTNVEAPISAIVLALFLDLVLRHRPAPATPEAS